MSEAYFLLGHPLGHRLSPFIHKHLFVLSGRDASYSLCDVPPEMLAAQMPPLLGSAGFNVTVPHKQAVIPFLDRLEGRAALYRSVNTVALRDGQAVGYNTDAEGFLQALKAAGVALEGRVLLLGSGGVARTFACEAALAGCRIVNAVRPGSEEKGRDIARAACTLREVPYDVVTYDGIYGDFDMIINGTTVGMHPHADACPVADGVLRRVRAVFDAVYNPGQTLLLQKAAACGAVTVGGMDMLVWQAAEAHAVWYGAQFTAQQLQILSAAAEAERQAQFG